jgi:AcrR family transcriptional regulator
MADIATPRDGPFAFRAGPDPLSALARLPVGRHRLPREVVEENQRNRLMAAALDVFAERGYAAASIADLVKVARVSRTTFHALYPDKEACFLATYDVVVAWLTEQAIEAAVATQGWERRAVAVIDTLTRLLAADPRLARLCTIEVYLAGAPAARRQEALIERLAAALRGGRSVDQLSPIVESVLVGGAISVIARQVQAGEGDRLLELGPELSEILLAPYLGAAARDLVTAGS